MRATQFLTTLLTCSLSLSTASAAGDGAAQEIEELIGRLNSTAAFYFGYSPNYAENEFLPLPRAEGGYPSGTYSSEDDNPHAPSDVIERIVRKGSIAVPVLLKHLGDLQPTKIPPISVAPKGDRLFSSRWIQFSDEYDFNRRTAKKSPQGVNKEPSFDGKRLASYTITVGDLCFVALGQIVNRNFTAAGGRPTSGTLINSPTQTPALREAAKEEFGAFTEDQHRQLLVSDLLRPDHVGRQIGAYQRLCVYYPELLETNVVRCLNAPIYDENAVEAFVTGQLYAARTLSDAKIIFDSYIRANGKAYADGVRVQLGSDLSTQEEIRQGKLPSILARKGNPRELLVSLYGKPKDVKSADVIYVDSLSVQEVWMFVKALRHDTSKEIDKAVYRVFVTSYEAADDDQYINPKHPYLALACLNRLTGHHFDGVGIRSYLKDGTSNVKYETIELERMVDDVPEVKKQLTEVYRCSNWRFEVTETNQPATGKNRSGAR